MISLIIVDYKTIPKTMHYIQECYQAFVSNENTHIIIVDNWQDEQEGLSYIEREYHAKTQQLSIAEIEVPVYECTFADRTITYIAARTNLGYAKGNNLGAKIASFLYQDAYYLFSNNDLRFTESFNIQSLIKPILENKRVAVVGPHIVSRENSQQSPRKRPVVKIGLFAYYWDMLLPKGFKFEKWITDIDYGAQSGECEWVTGSFLIVDANKFNQANGFDKHTFLFYEEVILASRLQRENYCMYYTDTVKLIHEHGETVKSAFSIIKGLDISFASSIYYFKEYRHVSSAIIILAYCNYYLFKILFRIKKVIGNLC